MPFLPIFLKERLGFIVPLTLFLVVMLLYLNTKSFAKTTLILLVEPVLNPVWAWAAQGERPGPWALFGGLVILGATTVKGWLDARSGRTPVPPAETVLPAQSNRGAA